MRDKEVAEAVAGQLTKAGIKTTLRTYEFVNYLNNLVYVHKAGPVWLIGWGQPTMDAEAIYVPLFKTPNIFANWHNEDFNGMVEEAQSQMDEKKRLAQYQRINKLWIEEVPAIPLYQQIDLYGANKRLAWKARSDELIRAYDMSLKDGKYRPRTIRPGVPRNPGRNGQRTRQPQQGLARAAISRPGLLEAGTTGRSR